MAIGDTVQAGLMRFDSSAYERAGQANAQANAAFGNALNQVARGFLEGQEKKARTEEMTGYLMNQGVSESDAKAIAKKPFLQKEYQRKKETEAQMEMEKNRLAMQARSIAAQAKAASETNMIRQGELGLKKQAQELAIKDANELKDLQRGIARFQTAEQELPITQKELDDPNFVPPPLDPDPFVAPPTTYTTQAPAVERLPESFQPQGQRVIDEINKGELTPMQGNRILEQIEKRAIAEAPEMMSPEDRLDYLTKLEELERRRREEERSQVEEERKDEKFKGEQKIKSFDGLDFEGAKLRGSIQDVTEAKKAKQGLSNFNAIMTDLERLKELGRLREEELILDRDFKQEAAVIANRVRGQIREDILGPGTVTDSERKLLEEQVPDPTAGFDMLSTTYGAKGVSLIEKLQNNLRKKVANNLANYGVTFAPSGQPATPVNQAQSNNTLTTRDGADVEFINLAQ